jgi:hypothetical protein
VRVVFSCSSSRVLLQLADLAVHWIAGITLFWRLANIVKRC